MGKFTDIFNRLNPRTGRMITENGSSVNVADLARKFDHAMDPFGPLRVTEYQPIFSSQPLPVSVINDRTFTSGGATIEYVDGEFKLSRSGGETCRLETGQRGRYQAGIIGVPGVGARRTTTPTGTTAYRVGYFDSMDGFGFKETSEGLHTFVRAGGVEVYSRHRDQWLDPLDGGGKSGRQIDLLDGRVHRMPFAWYGYGSIVFGIVATGTREQDDEIIIVDRWAPSQKMSFHNPNLPVSVEITGDSAGEIFVGGRQYGVFGQINLRRRLVGERRTGQSVGTGSGLVPLISARIRDVDPWSRIPIQVEGMSLQTDANMDWVIVLGATLTNGGSALTDSDWNISQFSQGDTSTEFNINADAMTGGEIIAGPAFIRGGGGSNLGSDSENIPSQDVPIGEPVTLAVEPHSSTAAIRSALRMAELR